MARKRIAVVGDVILVAAVGIASVTLIAGDTLQGAISNWRRDRAALKEVHSRWDDIVGVRSELGNRNGVNVLVEFSDYECPFCRESHRVVTDFLRRRSDVRVVYRHLPLMGVHPQAEGAARAAICAEEQNVFAAMHALLMETEAWERGAGCGRLAREAGVRDTAAFRGCLRSSGTEARLTRDRELAAALGVTGTPVFLSFDGFHHGVVRGVTELEQLLSS